MPEDVPEEKPDAVIATPQEIMECREFVQGARSVKAFIDVKTQVVRFFGQAQYVLLQGADGMSVRAEPFGLSPETTEKYLQGVQRQETPVVPGMFPIKMPNSGESVDSSAWEAALLPVAFANFELSCAAFKGEVSAIYTKQMRQNMQAPPSLMGPDGKPLRR